MSEARKSIKAKRNVEKDKWHLKKKQIYIEL